MCSLTVLYSISAIQWIINQARTTGRPSVINISVRYTVNAMLDAAVTDVSLFYSTYIKLTTFPFILYSRRSMLVSML